MRAPRFRGSLYIPITASLIALSCFFWYHSPTPIYKRCENERKLLNHPTPYHSERLKLHQVLRRASMHDKTVILTILYKEWSNPGSILDLFLESFLIGRGTRRLLNHIAVITMDSQSFQKCMSMHPHCIRPSAFGNFFHTQDLAWKRNNAMFEVLELGYNVIFTEVDVMWLRNPFPNFQAEHGLTISSSCNATPSDKQSRGYKRSGGVFHLSSDERSAEFISYWRLKRALYPEDHAQESLCDVLVQSPEMVETSGLKVHYVDDKYFAGFCERISTDMEDVYTVQANCCYDLESKVHDLRLVLDDWISITAHSTTKTLASSWRAPKKCLRQE